MPVFVEWEWKEQTKSFLMIFTFYDDFSKPNLRLRKMKVRRTSHPKYDPPFKPVTTWAPSHLELGLLSEILAYANLINGLKLTEKRKLRDKLEGRKTVYDGNEYTLLCHLCPEYIDYLKKKLKPYIT